MLRAVYRPFAAPSWRAPASSAVRRIALLAGAILSEPAWVAGSATQWVATWSTAPYLVEEANMPPSPGLSGNTLRQVVRVSIGGDTVRLRLSNVNNAHPVVLRRANLAASKGAGAIEVAGLAVLRFQGAEGATLEPGATVVSDPVAFKLAPSMRLAITLHYGATSPNMTGHVGSRTNSYLLAGDRSAAADFIGAAVTPHWYSISSLEVRAPESAGAVAVIGNSITDGYGLTPDLQNRWTDILSEALLANPGTREVAVLNLGIGATTVLGEVPTAGVLRFQRDVLEQPGLRWALIYHGVNDIGGGATAPALVEGLSRMAAAARAKPVKVYGATLLPFNGHAYYTPQNESRRQEVNRWIRTGGAFDAVIDFDRTLRDPADSTRMRAAYRNDWLHPNAEGYKAMGNSVDPKLFAAPVTQTAGPRPPRPKAKVPLHYRGREHRADGQALPRGVGPPAARLR